jgi:hypothetical protein
MSTADTAGAYIPAPQHGRHLPVHDLTVRVYAGAHTCDTRDVDVTDGGFDEVAAILLAWHDEIAELGGRAIRAEARAVTDLEAELVGVRSQLDRVRALHKPSMLQGWCQECAAVWPCPTVVALGEAT